MAELHFLNVGNGDCILIKHNSGRWTMFDISCGNLEQTSIEKAAHKVAMVRALKEGANFGMRDRPTNPLNYLDQLDVKSLFRFVLSHPDMDHMDGFDALMDRVTVHNFWDSGARRKKPDFEGGPFKEEDWDRYVKVHNGKEDGTTVVKANAGRKFKFANQNDDETSGGDYVHILAPTKELADAGTESDDVNDASYVLLYRSSAGKIILAGDSHDDTWTHILENHKDTVKDCLLLIAPHHGRKSGRSYEFLDVLKPKLTLFGCADNEHLAYKAYQSRKLPIITNTEAGCVVAEISGETASIYVENKVFAEKQLAGDVFNTNRLGFFFVQTLTQ